VEEKFIGFVFHELFPFSFPSAKRACCCKKVCRAGVRPPGCPCVNYAVPRGKWNACPIIFSAFGQPKAELSGGKGGGDSRSQCITKRSAVTLVKHDGWQRYERWLGEQLVCYQSLL
jgi:hypothetical protein